MADTVGNRLGERATFNYVTDSGETVAYQSDRSVGLAVGNTLSTSPGRPTSVSGKYLRGRYILVQQTTDPSVKKKIVIGAVANALFASDSSSTVTINGVGFTVTGRVGEAVTFLAASDPA